MPAVDIIQPDILYPGECAERCRLLIWLSLPVFGHAALCQSITGDIIYHASDARPAVPGKYLLSIEGADYYPCMAFTLILLGK